MPMDVSRQTDTDLLIRHDWGASEVATFFDLPMNDLLFKAHSIHRQFFDVNRLQLSTLMNIRTGGCPEDCGYCPQSVHFESGRNSSGLAAINDVLEAATIARQNGATRFCMGAAWRTPRPKDLAIVAEMVTGVKQLGMETCVTLGMLTKQQALLLRDAGLDYYNHNLDTSEEYYHKIVSTRTYKDRLDTLDNVRDAGINVCCGGILGMGESRSDRVGLLLTLANLPKHPESVPVNMLVKVQGTRMEHVEDLEPLELVRTIAVARILMPTAYVRLSAGRQFLPDEGQALCFFAGANSVFYGDRLLTTANPQIEKDRMLFNRLGLVPDSAFQ